MKNLKATILTNDYAEAIERKFNDNINDTARGMGFQYKLTIIAGRVYDRIIQDYSVGEGQGTNRSIHVFVKRATGELVKAATYDAPQKNSDGTPAVRFNISTKEGFAEALNLAISSGGYLYKR